MYKKQKPIVEKDVVLVYVENKPGFFARVEHIVPDMKPKWWQVTFLILQLPLTVVTWIIDDEQIRGADFTMSGIPIRIEKVVAPTVNESKTAPSKDKEAGKPEQPKAQKQARILSLTDKNNPEV